MAKNKKAQILTAIMCASTVACVYPAIPAYAASGSITIDGTEVSINEIENGSWAAGSDGAGYIIFDNNGNFNITKPAGTTQETIFSTDSDGNVVISGGINIANGILNVSSEPEGISFLNNRIAMDTTGDFIVGHDATNPNNDKFIVRGTTGNVETEGTIDAVGTITSSDGDIQSTKGDVLSFNRDLDDEISLNEVGYNTQAITYSPGSGANPGTTKINSILDVNNNKITNVATPTASSAGTDAANKMYVDNAIKGVTYEKGDGINIDEATETAGPKISVVGNTLNGIKVDEQYGIGVKNGDGIGFDGEGNVIVKTAEDNSGLDFDDDGNMYVAVKENAGLNVDNDGLSVNADNGLEINSETGALQVKAGKGLQINSATKELEAFSSDPNIIIDETAGITLNPELTNMTSISFKGSDVSISASGINAGNKEIKGVVTNENSTNDVAVNKGYVDNAVKNATGKTYTGDQGIAVNNDKNTISVKTTDANSGLQFDEDGKMSVAVKDNSGINLDNDGLSVNAGNGLEINSEDGSLQVKAGKGLQINSATKELEAFSSDPNIIIDETAGITLNPELTNMTSISFKGSDVSISASGINAGNKEIKGVVTNENSTNDVAVNKGYVDNAVKNATGKTYTGDQGIAVNNDKNTISVKTTDANSGLQFDEDGKMSVAVKDNSGINLDNDGLSVNAGNGLEINSEDGSLQVKAGKGLQINSDTKELEAFSSDPNIQINGTTGITLNPALENMTSINFKNSTVSISADGINAGDKEIKGVLTNEDSADTVAASKGYVDTQIKSIDTTTYEAGNGIDLTDDTISVKTTDQNSGLKFDNDGKMSVAVKDKAGINLDNDGLSVNAGNGLEISETGSLQVKSADDNITVTADGVGLNPELTGITFIDGASVAGTANGGLTISGVTLENNTVTADKATFGSGDNTTVIDDNGVVSKGKIQGTTITDGTYTLGDVGAKTDVFDINVDNKTATFKGDVVSTYDEDTTYSLNDLGQKIDGLHIDGVDLDNIKGITRTVEGEDKTPGAGTTSIETSTHINSAGLYVGNSAEEKTFSVDKQTGNVTGGTYNGVEIKTTPNTSTETSDDVDAVINGANVNEIDRTVDDISSRVKHIDHIDADEATGQKDTTVIEGSTYISSDGLSIKNNDTDVFNVDTQGNITASNGDGKGIFTMDQSGIGFGFGEDGKASFTMNDTGLKLGFGANSFTMNADGSTLDSPITFKGKDGDITVIDGDTITTDTLNVNMINLSGKIIDGNGTESEGTLTIRKDGYINADYTGDNGEHSHFTNDRNGVNSEYTYGNTTATSTTGNISNNTGETVVGVKDQVGDSTSSVMTDGQIKDTVGNNTVTTTDEGTKFENGTGSSTNIDGGSITVTGSGNSGTTTITGGTITTDKIVTDEIVIGDEKNNFHLGNDSTLEGTITDENGNSFNYSNTAEGYKSTATDSKGNTATTNVSADNINNTVSNGKNSASTNLDANGFTVTDSKSSNTATITGDDVVINTGKDNEIKLSDMGQVSDIDSELQENSKFENNQTVVGAVNAEADIRRNEVARIDNNIEQLDGRVGSLENRMGDVEERIDKVGAMAAAIANLRTMGFDPEAPTEIAVGIGQYKSETGLALGIFHYPNEDFMLSASISTSGDEVMGGIGATWKLGRKSSAEKARDIEEKRIQKAEEMQKMAREEKVKAQRERHAQLLAERQHHNNISDGQSA